MHSTVLVPQTPPTPSAHHFSLVSQNHNIAEPKHTTQGKDEVLLWSFDKTIPTQGLLTSVFQSSSISHGLHQWSCSVLVDMQACVFLSPAGEVQTDQNQTTRTNSNITPVVTVSNTLLHIVCCNQNGCF